MQVAATLLFFDATLILAPIIHEMSRIERGVAYTTNVDNLKKRDYKALIVPALFITAMFFQSSTLLSLSVILSQVYALAFPESEVIKANGVSAFKLGFNVDRNSSTETLAKRDGIPVTATNVGSAYTTKILFGSERAEGHVLIDTGSADLWIKTISNGGVYDPSKSSTYRDLGQPFLINYLKGKASGSYAEDTIFIGDDSTEVEKFQFAAATETELLNHDGLLGLGLQSAEHADIKYWNLPYALKNQGYIDKVGYSLFLDDENSTSGTVLFGAIDKAKFEGELVTLPIVNNYRLLVAVDSISIDGKTDNTSFDAVLDSGTTYTYLHTEQWKLVDDVFKDLNEPGDPNKFLEITIATLTFKIPYSELIQQDDDGEWNYGVGVRDGDDAILGDNFLRHAYVVYDIEDKQISLANVKYTDDSEIVPL